MSVTQTSRVLERPHNSAGERHYTPQEVANLWGLSPKTVTRLFENEPGVLVVALPRLRSSKRHRTLRIPHSVLERVHRKQEKA